MFTTNKVVPQTIKSFTVDNMEPGKRFCREHQGMTAKTSYREKGQKKLEGYLADG